MRFTLSHKAYVIFRFSRWRYPSVYTSYNSWLIGFNSVTPISSL